VKLSRMSTPALVAAGLLWGAVAWALSSGDLIKQGVSVLKDGKAQEALDLFTKAQRLDPNSARPHYYMGTALERMNAPDSAKVEYQTAIRMDPKYTEALTGLGKLERKQGKKEEGTAKLEEAVKFNPKDAPGLYALGQAYLEDKRYDDAEKVFRKGTLLKQGRAVFLAGTALAVEGKGNLKDAEEIFIRARETEPNNLRVRLDLGGFYMRKKIPVLAAPEYGHATELEPKNPEYHYLYGKALVGMNEFNAALKAFVDATQQDSTYAPAYLESGRLYYRAHRSKEASDNFRTYTALKPDDLHGFAELGQALAESRDPSDHQEAIVQLTKAVDDTTIANDPKVLGTLCKLYSEQGDAGRENAITFCERYSSKVDSMSAEEHMRIGTLLVAAGDSAAAVPHLQAAVAQDSTFRKDANFQLGFLFFARQDFGSAVPYFQQCLQADSTFLPALLNLGLAQLQLKQPSEAVGTLRRALAVKNDAKTMVWIGQTMLQMPADSLPVALDMFQRASAADSSNGDALRGAGLSLLLMGNCGEAEGYFQKATSLEPQHLQGHVWLAQTYNKCGDANSAKLEFNKALEIDPNNQQASQGLALIRQWEQKKLQQKSAQPIKGASTTP